MDAELARVEVNAEWAIGVLENLILLNLNQLNRTEGKQALDFAIAALKAQGEAELSPVTGYEIECSRIAVPGCDEARQVRLKIGVQSFRINDYCENAEQAQFMVDMLNKALQKLGRNADSRSARDE